MNTYKLAEEIVALSDANSWEIAKTEWVLETIIFADEPQTCLCGHFPIIELCELKNVKNSNLAIVGNCCVKKFLGLPSDKIFEAVKRVKKDSLANLNGETIEHAHAKGWINTWEYNFYSDIFRKRKFTEKQIAKKKQINEKILAKMNRK